MLLLRMSVTVENLDQMQINVKTLRLKNTEVARKKNKKALQ